MRVCVYAWWQPPQANLNYAASTLGVAWLGMDVGEQDGRYVGNFAGQMPVAAASKQDQYLNFRTHFAAMEGILGDRVVALTSLSFAHYMVTSGMYTGTRVWLFDCRTKPVQ